MRLNQAASTALMARLEAQKAICDASEKELHKKYKQKDEIEKQIRPEWEHARKRSRMDDTLLEEKDSKTVLYLPGIKPRTTPLHKELRVFLEEEQRASQAGLSSGEEQKHEEIQAQETEENPEKHNGSIIALEDETPLEDKLQKLNIQFTVPREPEIEEDEESRKQRGKGNIEKWLQMLLENTQEDLDTQNANENEKSGTDEIIRNLNLKYPQEVKISRSPEHEEEVNEENKQIAAEKGGVKRVEEIIEIEARKTQKEERNMSEVSGIGEVFGSCSFEGRERKDHNGKERKLVRSESARTFRRIPSSPSLILGMRKGVDCIGKKPMVNGDDDFDGDQVGGNSFIMSSIKSIKKAVKI